MHSTLLWVFPIFLFFLSPGSDFWKIAWLLCLTIIFFLFYSWGKLCFGRFNLFRRRTQDDGSLFLFPQNLTGTGRGVLVWFARPTSNGVIFSAVTCRHSRHVASQYELEEGCCMSIGLRDCTSLSFLSFAFPPSFVFLSQRALFTELD